jgi:hypothetical protein
MFKRWVIAAAIVCVLGLCTAVSFTRPFTDGADIVTALAIIAMVVLQLLAARSTRAQISRGILGDSSIREATFASFLPWIALSSLVVAFELFNYLSSPRTMHPTLSSLSDELSRSHLGKAALCLVWLALGALLLRRPRVLSDRNDN